MNISQAIETSGHLVLQPGPAAAEQSVILNSTQNCKLTGGLVNKPEQYVQMLCILSQNPMSILGVSGTSCRKLSFSFKRIFPVHWVS